jgi:chromosome partitioning protein
MSIVSDCNNTYIFCNVKGGVGKTNLLYQSAGVISSMGYSVLCVDGDPQHNLTKALIGKTPKLGLMELLYGECKFTDVILRPYPDSALLQNIYLLPCNYELFFFTNDEEEYEHKNTIKKPLLLKTIFDKAKIDGYMDYDFIFFDTNPSISLITTNILIYAKNIVGVFDASLDSIEGFQFLENRIVKPIQDKINHDLKLFGMIINNSDRRTTFSAAVLKTIIRLYGDLVFDESITPSTKNKQSRAARIPLIEYEPKHPSTLQFNALTLEFLKRIGETNG